MNMRWVSARGPMFCAVFALPLALVACNQKDTGPAPGDGMDLPQQAAPVPAATVDPEAARSLVSFAGRDTDGDGKITLPEQSQAAAKMFAALDTDDDGTVTVIEMDQGRVAMKLPETPSSEKMIAGADSDHDGKLTLAEWVANSNADFEVSDTNHDDVLDRSEWAARKRRREIEAADA